MHNTIFKPHPNFGEISDFETLMDFYKEYVASKEGFLYRGHHNIEHELKSSLEVKYIDHYHEERRDLIKIEFNVLREFKRKAGVNITSLPKEKEYLEWLGLIRHYQGPTRLMDWTYSFFVALFFSVQNAKVDDQCRIFAINKNLLEKQLIRVLEEIGLLNDYNKNPRLTDENIRCKILGDPFKEKQGEKFVLHATPFRLEKRLSLQQGTFLLQGNLERSFEENLKSMGFRDFKEDGCYRIDLDLNKEFMRDIWKHLYMSNITEETLFPGLDGLAQSLNHRFILGWSPEPNKDNLENKLVTENQ